MRNKKHYYQPLLICGGMGHYSDNGRDDWGAGF